MPALLADLGYDPEHVLRLAGTSVDAVRDADALVPLAQFAAILHAAQSVTACGHIGLLLGDRGGLDVLGLMGEYMRNAPTVGTAMTDLARHQHRYARGARPYVMRTGDEVMFGYRVHVRGIPTIEQVCLGAAAVGNRIVLELCGRSPVEVLLGISAPADVGPYRTIFKVPVRFNAEHFGLVYPASLLTEPVVGANPSRRIKLHAAIERYWAIEPPDIASQLRRVLGETVLGGDHSLEATAATLRLHPRTLNRRLREYSTTFRRELAEARFAIACQFLESTELSITDIASAFGYADVSVFTRSFERWSGTPPSDWRRARQAVLKAVPRGEGEA
jgi:AraC-like DNA-binding protein